MSQLLYSANVSLLYENSPLEVSLEHAATSGFDTVELWFPYHIPIPDLKAILDNLELSLIVVNVDAGDQALGEWGTATNPKRHDHFRQSFEQALTYAVALDVSMVHVMAGKQVPELSRYEQRECFLDNLTWALLQVQATEISLLLEPLNNIDIPDYFLTRIEEAVQLIEELDSDQVGIMCDLYHMQRMQGNLIERIKKHHHFIRHYQIADVPGRHDPGTGEVNFPNVLKVIAETGYDGYVGLEYRPIRSVEETLGWLNGLADQLNLQ